MAKKNEITVAKIGRPSLFDKVDLIQVEKLCKLGATDKQIADFYEVNEDTIYEWKKVHPEFSEALKRGKLVADSTIADSLFQRAKGYEHADCEVLMAQKTGEPVIVPLIKYYPPDTTACIFWLKNRQPELWRDKVEIESNNKISQVNAIQVIIEYPNGNPG